ncbi:MAG TPA: anti-sigma factor [Bacilli bacterium]
MQEKTNQPCELYVSYISGHCTDEEQALFEQHLPLCPSCQEEVEGFHQVWQALPWQVEMVEVPAELKAEVMGAIFPAALSTEARATPAALKGAMRAAPSTSNEIFVVKQGLSKAWAFGLAAAVTLIVIAGSLWNYNLIQQQNAMSDQVLNQPADVEMIYTLNAALEGSEANGKACILKQGNNMKLVVYLYGLEETQGKEAYQVWLIDKGQRRNAGTFHVDHQGLGVLTYELDETERSFDSIGITLEPDANGSEPRGRKVVGT